MTCRELAEFLMQYLDGELPEPERESFERHVGMCPPCLAYLRTYEEAVALGRAACAEPEGPPPEGMPEELVRAILAARSRDA